MKALVTGSKGQDGSYLVPLLKEKGYEVIEFSGDLRERKDVDKVITKDLDEIYNLGAITRTADEETFGIIRTNSFGLMYILEAVKKVNPEIKVFQAGSRAMFGDSDETPQNENTPLSPTDTYGLSKAFSHYICDRYRNNLKIWEAIFYNHESPRRPNIYVTKKIIEDAVAIKQGKKEYLEIGNLDVQVDWGYAPEYMEWCYKMLQEARPDSYIIATGEAHSVREFVQRVFKKLGIKWNNHIKVNPEFVRPLDPAVAIGDIRKAEREFGFKPKVKFEELIDIMLDDYLKHNS